MARFTLSYCIVFLFSTASALYFHIGETEKKCFIEEIPDETMVVGNYKVEMLDKAKNEYIPTITGLGIHVEIKDPESKVIMSRRTGNYKIEMYEVETKKYVSGMVHGLGMQVVILDPDKKTILDRTYASEGRFTFTSHTAGEHSLCLHSNSTAWFGGTQLRVHLDIQVGEHAQDYQQIATKDKLTELQLRVRQLLDQTEQVQKEQNYQRYREERFRQTSESTNQRVLWWSIAQTLILLVTGFWQMRHLKSFFEAKKLV